MEFQCGVVSDVGTTRKENQDSACIHIQNSIIGNVGLAVVCDGMGGLSHGEFASQSMIEKIEKWYDSEFKELLVQGVEVNNRKMPRAAARGIFYVIRIFGLFLQVLLYEAF